MILAEGRPGCSNIVCVLCVCVCVCVCVRACVCVCVCEGVQNSEGSEFGYQEWGILTKMIYRDSVERVFYKAVQPKGWAL